MISHVRIEPFGFPLAGSCSPRPPITSHRSFVEAGKLMIGRDAIASIQRLFHPEPSPPDVLVRRREQTYRVFVFASWDRSQH